MNNYMDNKMYYIAYVTHSIENSKNYGHSQNKVSRNCFTPNNGN